VTEPKGFRRDIMVLHHLSDLMEKHPDLPRPNVELGPRYQVEEKVHISWFMHADWNLRVDKWDTLAEDYEDYQARRKDAQRIDLEQRIAAVLDAMGPDVEWTKNDPTEDEYYYKLTAVWHGAAVRIATTRDAVCEKVVVLETEREEEVPDPEVIEAATKSAPLVKVTVKDTITEWQCNTALAEKTAPVHARTITKSQVNA
jgi:hypothetical protein